MKKLQHLLLISLFPSILFSQNLLQRSNSLKGSFKENLFVKLDSNKINEIYLVDSSSFLSGVKVPNITNLERVTEDIKKERSGYEAVYEKVQDLNVEISNQTELKKQLTNSISNLDKKVAQLKKDFKKDKKLALELAKMETNLKDAKAKLDTSDKRISEFSNEVLQFKDKLNVSDKKVTDLSSQYQKEKEALFDLEQLFFERTSGYFRESQSDLNEALKKLAENLYLIDTSLNNTDVFNKAVLDQDDYKEIRKCIFDMLEKEKELTKKVEKIAEINKDYKSKRDGLEAYGIVFNNKLADSLKVNVADAFFTEFAKLDSTLEKLDKDLKAEVNNIQKEVIALQETYKEKGTVINKKLEKYNKKETSDNATVIGGANKVLNEDGALIPEISLVASRKIEEKEGSNFLAQIKLFLAAPSADSKNNPNYNLFIPEASNWGLSTDFNWGFIPSNKSKTRDNKVNRNSRMLGLSVSTYLMGKTMVPDTSKLSDNFHAFSAQAKVGFQLIVIPNALSVYLNANGLILPTNKAKFEQFYPGVRTTIGFLDMGISSYLNLAKKTDDFFLYIDIGAILNGGDARQFSKTDDKIIPKFRLSLVKDFDF